MYLNYDAYSNKQTKSTVTVVKHFYRIDFGLVEAI